MLGGSELVAFAPATDLDRARRFYAQTLGLRLREQTDFACVFEAPNAVLRVTQVQHVKPAPYTVLGWRVEDIATTGRGLAAAGVEARRYDGLEQDGLGVWRSPSGAQVLWFEDPDGNVLSVTEL